LIGNNNKFGKIGEKAKVVATTEQSALSIQSTTTEHSETTELDEKEKGKITADQGGQGGSLTTTIEPPAEARKQEELSTTRVNGEAEGSQKPRQLPSKR